MKGWKTIRKQRAAGTRPSMLEQPDGFTIIGNPSGCLAARSWGCLITSEVISNTNMGNLAKPRTKCWFYTTIWGGNTKEAATLGVRCNSPAQGTFAYSKACFLFSFCARFECAARVTAAVGTAMPNSLALQQWHSNSPAKSHSCLFRNLAAAASTCTNLFTLGCTVKSTEADVCSSAELTVFGYGFVQNVTTGPGDHRLYVRWREVGGTKKPQRLTHRRSTAVTSPWSVSELHKAGDEILIHQAL